MYVRPLYNLSEFVNLTTLLDLNELGNGILVYGFYGLSDLIIFNLKYRTDF